MACLGGGQDRGFDPSPWNLTALGAVAALGGCGPSILLGDTEGISNPTTGDTDGVTMGDGGPLTTGHPQPTTTSTPTTTPTGGCNSMYDCPPGYDCINGTCEYYCLDCCDGDCYYEEGPYYYECYGDEDCAPGQVCNFDYGQPYCQALPAVEACPDPPSFVPIPMNIPAGNDIVGLAFVDVDPAPGDELLVSRADGAWLLRNGQAAAPLPVPDGDFILYADSADFTGDGNAEVAAAFGPDGDLGVFAADGMGGFSFLGVVASAQVSGLSALDFDGNGLADLALIANDVSSIRFGGGDGTFADPQHIWGGFTFRIGSGDVDMPGFPDAVVNTDSGLLAAFGNMAGTVDYTLLAQPYGFLSSAPIVVGDPTGAGIDGVFTFNPIAAWNLVRYYYDGVAADIAVIGPAVEIGASGDFDGDGTDDFVLYGDGAITYLRTSARAGPLECVGFVDLLEPYTLISAGDFDGDGIDEVALGDAAGLTVYGVM